MSVQNDIFEAVIELAEAAIAPPKKSGSVTPSILIGAMPAKNGIAMQISTGAPATTFINKGMPYEFTLVLNGKGASQKTVSDKLNAIHIALTQAKTYPSAAAYQITDIETVATPSYIGREEDKQYLYGSSLRVKAYIFKVAQQ